MPNWKKLIVSGSDASLSTLTITNSGSTDDSLLLTATEDSSTAAPVITLKRNTASPADADYLGQLKFKGENDADQEVVYAKITAKIQDASDGSEDGLIEFANKKAGSNNITARLKSDKLQLLNGTELEVDGQVSASAFIGDGSGLTGVSAAGTLSSSAQIASDISGSTTSTSSSIASDIASLVTFSSSLETTIYDYTGSFTGDGSALTGITSEVTEQATIVDSFTSQTSVVTTHNFGTKNVIVSVFDSNDAMIIPDSIVTTDTNTVTTTLDTSTSGRVVVAKGGHIVSGSIQQSTYRESITGASSYAVTHSLSEDYPIVQVYNSSRSQVIPSEITTTSANALDISFNSVFSGTVVVKK